MRRTGWPFLTHRFWLHALLALALLLALQVRATHESAHIGEPSSGKDAHVCELCLGFSTLSAVPLASVSVPPVAFFSSPEHAARLTGARLIAKPPYQSRDPPSIS